MQKTEHTPGPWHSPLFHGSAEENAQALSLGLELVPALFNNGERFVMAESGRVAVVDCQTPFKRGQGNRSECAERDANARLIAAAPDLLASLMEIYELEEGPGETDRPMMARAKAAIAKATGAA